MPLDLFPYQQTGADFLASKTRAGLFDMMGIGKTAQAIGALDRLNLKRGIIVCPAAVREVWKGEFQKFARVQRKVIKGRDIQDLNLWLRGKVDVLLLSYEMATAWGKRMEGDVFGFIIFDEAHYMKSKTAARTSAMLGHDCDGKYGLARWAAYAWFLTGTPNPNDVADCWTVMRFCRATPLTQQIFRDRYFTKRTGTFSTSHTCRPEMLGELKQAIQSFSIRRTTEQACLQLPPIWLTTTSIDGDTKAVRDLLLDHPNLEKAILEAVDKGGLSFLDAAHVMTLRRLVAEAKAPAYVELLAEEFKSGRGKTLIGAIHVRAINLIAEGLAKHGIKALVFNGQVSEAQRVAAVKTWREDPDALAFLINLKSGGTGQTFIEGHDVDLYESGWSPTDNAQFFKRIHRVGQTHAVHGRYITLANSIDTVVSEVVARKTASLVQTGTFADEFAA